MTKAILLLHGFATNKTDFDPIIDELNNLYDHVECHNLPGHNGEPRLKGFTAHATMKYVDNAISKLEKKYDIIDVLGFSMGGAIVLRYMRRHRGYGVRKLALLAAAAPRFTCSPDFPLGMEPSQVDQLIEEIETDRARFSEKFSRQLLYTPHSEAVLNWFQGISEEASQNATIRTACSLRNEDGRKDLESVHVPTAIFHGKQDEVVPYALGEYQHQHIPCSELIPFEKSGHGVFYDELERFNGEFLRFLLN